MDFRRWFIALSVLALMAGLASAQVGIAVGGSVSPNLSCTANAAATPVVRSEGYTELMGDILISCSGGQPAAVGSQVLTTNITVFLQPGLQVTSRLMGANNASEATLLIDDPGSTLPTGASGGFGPKAPQLVCGQLTTGGCPTYVGLDGTGTYVIASSSPVTVNGVWPSAANIYQGLVNQLGANSVTFYGVPVLPPASAGVTRSFRITNVRYPTAGMSNQQQISAFISTNPSTILPISQSLLTIATVNSGLSSAVSNPVAFAQCDTTKNGAYQSAYVTFTEGFATSFKTRVVPLTNTLYAAEATNTATQNIPGGLYNLVAQNSESGFIVPGLFGSSSSTSAYQAGLADFGTRLKAVFTNIPQGVTLYVSVTPVNGTAVATTPPTFVGGQDTSVPWGVLVGTISGDANADSLAGSAATFSSLVIPVSASGTVTAHFANGTDNIAGLAYPLTPNAAGVAAAVWEVTNANNAKLENLKFGVFIGYTPVGASATNPYGLPLANNTPGATTNNVSLSFAPEPGGGSFSASQGPTLGTNIIPRFTILTPVNGPFAVINLCQTTLLYPYVTANPTGSALGQGFDTGIVVSNTSADPFNVKVNGVVPFGLSIPASGAVGGLTLQQAGSCSLYPYGVQTSATGTTSPWPSGAIPGCDLIANPSPGVNCFPVVKAGTVQSVLASTTLPGFTGYVIAVCNFQYAHGYAAVTDLGLRGLFSSYLALEMNTCGGYCTNPRGAGNEQLVH